MARLEMGMVDMDEEWFDWGIWMSGGGYGWSSRYGWGQGMWHIF